MSSTTTFISNSPPNTKDRSDSDNAPFLGPSVEDGDGKMKFVNKDIDKTRESTKPNSCRLHKKLLCILIGVTCAINALTLGLVYVITSQQKETKIAQLEDRVAKLSTMVSSMNATMPKTEQLLGSCCKVGIQGQKGEMGSLGPSGEKGDRGAHGGPGTQGNDGRKGEKGECLLGLPGRDGLKGEPGVPGLIGLPGNPGQKGRRGLIGFPGKVGESGPQGPKGDTGPSGITGMTGIQGPRGPIGEKGLKGSRGEKGVNGEKGDVGPEGQIGLKGDQGIPGVPGLDGLPGEMGDTGPRGPSGSVGPKGERGSKGESGVKGAKGDIGLNGGDGLPGLPGIQGPPGQKGQQGIKGDPCVNCSEDTAETCFTDSSLWKGTVTHTLNNRTCQRWDSQTPHMHDRINSDNFPDKNLTEAENFCRDPDGEGTPWCYTTDPSVPWEFCDVPHCDGFKDHYEPIIRLEDGRGLRNRGRVEVFHDGEWGTICDDNFGSQDAIVICRMLKYLSGTSRGSAYFGAGSGRIWLDELRCTGSESSILECTHNAWGSNDCGHAEDAGVECS